MRKEIKIIFLAMAIAAIFSISVSAQIRVENRTIDFDLIPDQITADTYLPIEKLVDAGLFEVDKVSNNRYIVLKNNNYYILQNNQQLVRSNLRNRNLKYAPVVINQHFLVSVEFLEGFLNFNVRVEKGLTMPDRIGRDDQIEENLRLRVYLNDDEFRIYDKLQLSIEIMNTGRDDINLRFNSAQKYNIYIKNRFGRVLYSWASDKIFSQAVQNIEIEGRDSLSFEEEIDLNQFREGRYYVEVEITAANYDFDPVEKEFKIED
ncbi:BsuPI-related putative proteinase inhibitor [Halanaerobium kushneri]|uniref:Copper amine oxidase N-terminal domain-containing protein n=1 Tax=Halanaerobium kushneri TaxID=56779 RepID=A0A1N6SIJ9_9FIRM|nr:BsuPI-related putative proteinase inhibitor [Halanaerobium kushneri]SIQ40911.1 Copper amine oxidase N-terminal domain-containing protein [Halanaerobium kushneri]